MNDLSLQGKVLKNKSILQHSEMLVLSINFALTPFYLYYLNRIMSVLMGGEGSPGAQLITAFFSFTFVINLIWFFRTLWLQIKMVLPIQITHQGIRIPQSSKNLQLVRWDEISSIKKGNAVSMFPILRGAYKVWKVETLRRPQFSLSKDVRYSFYITSNHEHHKELLALLKEKTGLKIEEPTRKPKIPTWQSGTRL